MRAITNQVFRTYDIRGIVDRDFDEEWVELLGYACGAFFLAGQQTRCVVGRDCRESSPAYAAALIRGLMRAGVSVINVGMVPTPMLYFAVKYLGLAAGVMVTASHNPQGYNGFKIWRGESTIHSGDIDEIRERMVRGYGEEGHGLGSSLDISEAYYRAVEDSVHLQRPLKVVVDGGNGAGGEYCVNLLRRLGAEVIPLYCEPDGSFPNHHPDPVVEDNMRDLARMVRECGADAGLGLDGDADRLGVVDNQGRLLFGDELLAIYAVDLMKRCGPATIVADVKCSRRLFADIRARGGEAVMNATGHSLIKARIRELDAPLAGEMSGHMFFAEGWYGFDDAIYGAARLLGILSRLDRPLSELPGWPHAVVTPEIHLDCPEACKSDVVNKARAFFGERYDVSLVDGVRLEFPDGWALVRASNTQPVLVLRYEADSPARLHELRRLVEEPLAEWIAACREENA